MYQQVIIVGNVGKVPEFRYTPQGVAVCYFSVAVNKRTGKGEDRKEKTTWFRVTVWRERAETANQWIKKGMKIMVIGEVEARAYIDRDGKPQATLELTAHEFKFLGDKGDNAATNEQGHQEEQGAFESEETSEMPF